MKAVVLHVVDRTTGGVPAAVSSYIANSPEQVKHVVFAPAELAGASRWSEQGIAHIPMPPGTFSRIRELRQTVANLQPDVVHAHSSFAGLYARLGVLSARTPIVYSPHCFAFERRDIGPVPRAIFVSAEWFLARNTSVIAACSDHEKSVAKRLGPRGLRTILVPNVASVADAGEPHRRRSSAEPAALRIATLGRVSPQKDPRYFADVVARFRRAGVAVEATWIGGGEDEGDLLESAGVHITGNLDKSGVEDLLDRQDVYVHTAAWEGFPIAVLDAHRRRLPILVRPIPAFSGVPSCLLVDAGFEPLISALSSEHAFHDWAGANIATWKRALGINDEVGQKLALESVWGAA